jgi:hypothetical protein
MEYQDSESFGTVPQDAEAFGSIPNASESFGTAQHTKERAENHTLTVREAARIFEDTGVARTERSIVNWCGPNKHGISRLDCYFEPNEHRYFITPESVERVIAEERAKAKAAETALAGSEPFGNLPNDVHSSFGTRPDASESFGTVPQDTVDGRSRATSPPELAADADALQRQIEELEKELIDLRITNRAKDFFIEQLKEDRQHFARERASLITQFAENARRIGELETRLELEAPKDEMAEVDPRPEEAGPDASFPHGHIPPTQPHKEEQPLLFRPSASPQDP